MKTKQLNEEQLENVSGGVTSNGEFKCKICKCYKEGHHWRAGYTYKRATGDTISMTVDICDECYPSVKDNPAYFNWKERE